MRKSLNGPFYPTNMDRLAREDLIPYLVGARKNGVASAADLEVFSSMSHHSAPPSDGEDKSNQSPTGFTLESVLLRLAGAAEEAASALAAEIAANPPTKRQLVDLAGKIYDSRRARDKYFKRSMFGEPAWDMLLALYCLPARGIRLTVSGLCYASGGPPTTALRWQGELTKLGLIERGPSELDRRKQMVRLTTEGRAILERYLTRIFAQCAASAAFPDRAGG